MNSRIINDITDFIFISDTPEKADVIFLPGGSHPAQAEYAAKLYQEGYAPLLMPSGGVSIKRDKWPGVQDKADIYNGEYSSDCEFFTDVLIKNGVPVSAIIGEDKSGYTKENALFSKRVAEKHNLKIKKAIIVCKSFHARRSLMCYQVAFPDVKFLVCPVDCMGISKYNWYTFDYGIKRVMGEVARIGTQFEDDIKEYL